MIFAPKGLLRGSAKKLMSVCVSVANILEFHRMAFAGVTLTVSEVKEALAFVIDFVKIQEFGPNLRQTTHLGVLKNDHFLITFF